MLPEVQDFDREACSFVIRLWREVADEDLEQGMWRGWIVHVQSGRRVSFQDTAVIEPFINRYLAKVPKPENKRGEGSL